MTELVYAEQALLDLERLSDFLMETNPQAAQDTTVLIFEALEILLQHPEIGRKVHYGQRELVISRGKTGYLALYRFLHPVDRILVLALRHQRESGYRESPAPSQPPRAGVLPSGQAAIERARCSFW